MTTTDLTRYLGVIAIVAWLAYGAYSVLTLTQRVNGLEATMGQVVNAINQARQPQPTSAAPK